MSKQEEVYRIGRLGKAHGVKGEVSFQFDDDIFDRVDADYLFLDIDGILVPFFMEEYRFRNDTVCLVKFCDIDTQQRAKELTGCDVYFPRALAEEAEEQPSLSMLVGFNIFDTSNGKTIGRIAALDDSTANILFELEDGTLIPANDELIERKIRQIQERKERKEKRRQEKLSKMGEDAKRNENVSAEVKAPAQLQKGDYVRIKGLTSVGTIESIDGKIATILFGGMKTKMRAERLERVEAPKQEKSKTEERNAAIVGSYGNLSNDTRNVIDNRKLNFHQDIDVRGMRGDEAINAITYFIDDAILVGMSRVRILHGTGTGILRQLIRQYLATVPNVSHFRDEHVQFGGAGITVVDLD